MVKLPTEFNFSPESPSNKLEDLMPLPVEPKPMMDSQLQDISQEVKKESVLQ
jgi:hypothetical protein